MSKNTSLKKSVTVLIVLLALLGVLIIELQLSSHISILAAFMCLLFYGRFKKFTWDEIYDGVIKRITPGTTSILIFLLIGALAVSRTLSGAIPTIMVYGFRLVSVRFFLPTASLTYAIVGVTISNSSTTISTIGIVFLGIGHLLGLDDAMTTGAVVSGVFLGNNCSSLPDTIDLTAGIGGVNLFEHVAGVRCTGSLVFVPSLILYTILGHNSHSAGLASVNETIQDMRTSFWIPPRALILPAILSGGVIKKVPAIPTLLAGSTAALVLSFIHEKSLTVGKAADILMSGYVANAPDPKLDKLFPRGGIMSMLGSASSILFALALGGLLIKYLIADTIVQELKEKMDRPSCLVGFTALGCTGINLTVGEQYLSTTLPGETFKRSFDDVGLSKAYLTRTLTDSSTIANSLVPWGVSGTFTVGTMRVSALHCLPFALFSILVPVFTVLSGFLSNRRRTKNRRKKKGGWDRST